jgi:hypothetical protein
MAFDDPPLQVGEHFTAAIHWRFFEPDREVRFWVGFEVEILMIDEEDLRFLVYLHRLTRLEANHPPETIDRWIPESIQRQAGRYAFVPYESATGRTLFLKEGTLTGRNQYFFDQDSDKFPSHITHVPDPPVDAND